jgi:ribonuclease HI
MLDLLDVFPKRGHAGNVLNEQADSLATGAASGGDKLVDKGYNS